MADERDKVVTMSGAREVPIMQSLFKTRITATGVKLSRKRGPRYCTDVGPGKKTGKCRCVKWKSGTPPPGYKSVNEQCGGDMGLKPIKR